MHPMYAVEKLTESQIHDSLSKCYAMKSHAESHGQLLMCDQIEVMIATLLDELNTREQAMLMAREKKERKNKSDDITFGEINKNDDIQDPKF